MRSRLRLALFSTVLLALTSTSTAFAQESFEESTFFENPSSSSLELCSESGSRAICTSLEDVECRVPTPNALSRRTDPRTRIRDWRIFPGECRAVYVGSHIPCFTPRKDELLIVPDFNRVWQNGQEFCDSNEFHVHFLPSKAGFFNLRTQPVLPTPLAQLYFVRNEGGFFASAGRGDYFFYVGPPTQAFVVPSGWLVQVGKKTYSTGYMVTSDHFLARRDRTFITELELEVN